MQPYAQVSLLTGPDSLSLSLLAPDAGATMEPEAAAPACMHRALQAALQGRTEQQQWAPALAQAWTWSKWHHITLGMQSQRAVTPVPLAAARGTDISERVNAGGSAICAAVIRSAALLQPAGPWPVPRQRSGSCATWRDGRSATYPVRACCCRSAYGAGRIVAFRADCSREHRCRNGAARLDAPRA
jgi:hypothetical protein